MSLRSRIWGALYNIDRTVASMFGASPQSTISAQAARAHRAGHWWGRILCWLLDRIDKGHCVEANEHAAKLEQADDGSER